MASSWRICAWSASTVSPFAGAGASATGSGGRAGRAPGTGAGTGGAWAHDRPERLGITTRPPATAASRRAVRTAFRDCISSSLVLEKMVVPVRPDALAHHAITVIVSTGGAANLRNNPV